MAIFVLLGEKKLALFDATGARRVSEDTAPIGTIGIVEDLSELANSPSLDALFTSDLTISEEHRVQNQITDHKIEGGGNISDNVRLLPRSFSVTGLITDTPSGLESLFIAPELINQLTQVPRRLQAYNTLKSLAISGALLDVTTSLEIYQNMIIEDWHVPIDVNTGRAIKFFITFKEAEFVSSQIVANSSLDGFGTTDTGTQIARTFVE